jgi:protein-tyrosine phosphatase
MSELNDDRTSFDVLFVCTGNICRSPLAEQLFRAHTLPLFDLIQTASAGTRALVGKSMTPEAAALSIALGGDPSGHSAMDLTARQVGRADLILVAAREHRSAVVSLVPRASRKTFTIREFHRLLGTYAERVPQAEQSVRGRDREGLRGFVSDVASMRGLARVVTPPVDDDIPDPYRRSLETYEEAGRLTSSAIAGIGHSLLVAVTKAEKTKRDGTSHNANLSTGHALLRSNQAGEL